MRELWHALGYDVVAEGVAQALREGDDVCVLRGPPGVGKSWLASGIGALWENSGGSTLVAFGDVGHSDMPFYALNLSLAALSSGLQAAAGPLVDAAKAGESLAGTAGLISAGVKLAGSVRRGRRRARKLFLGDIEQGILFQLERQSRKRPLLLIADDLHWWDSASLDLLRRLREPQMREAFPFLAAMRLLAVETADPHQHVAHPASHHALLRAATTREFKLERVSGDVFGEILVALGAGTPSPQDAATVYSLTGGHLALAHGFAVRIAQGSGNELLAAAASDGAVRKLVEARIESLGEVGQEVLPLLRVAAAIGVKFRRDELACAAGRDLAETGEALRRCRAENIVHLSDNSAMFVHDVYRQYFLAAGGADRATVYEELGNCLRRLRPADYELRSLTATNAEQARAAATWAVEAALQRQREGLGWRGLPSRVLQAMQDGAMLEVAERFEHALDHLDHYRFDACFEMLSGLPHALPESLAAEGDYLRGICLMATRSEEDRAQAITLLEGWGGYENREAEIGVRLMQLLLYGLAMLPDKQRGLVLEAKMKRVLRARSGMDAAAEDALYTLDRCAGALHLPERAVLLNRDAVQHFVAPQGQTVVRRPVEYYRCLTNLGANLLLLARYEEARAVHRDLEELIEEYAVGTFPRLDYALMNTLLNDYRLGAVDASEAARAQRTIVDSHGVAGDPFYPENALAVYLAISGDPDAAGELLDRLHALLAERRNPEPSMVYLIRANRTALRYVAGEVQGAILEWEELAEVAAAIPYVIRPYLVKRHERLQAEMRAGRTMSAAQFDVCLSGRPPEFGPLWAQLGRGFWLPEIEWWR